MKVVRVAVWMLCLLLSSCASGDDSITCIPPAVRGTCVEDVARDLEECFDPEGSCIFVVDDVRTTFEWENGARAEFEGESILPDTSRVVASDGTECGGMSPVMSADCRGLRNASRVGWVDSCFETSAAGDLERVRYVCEDGMEYAVDSSAAAPLGCDSQDYGIGTCVGPDGKRFDK